jgi:Txe/YoeB family toxin of toxin-antitoxin system
MTKTALKDLTELERSKLGRKANAVLELLMDDPFRSPPPAEQLRGDLKGFYSRRINSVHRVLYEIRPSEDPEFEGVVVVVRMRTHYGGIVPLFLF